MPNMVLQNTAAKVNSKELRNAWRKMSSCSNFQKLRSPMNDPGCPTQLSVTLKYRAMPKGQATSTPSSRKAGAISVYPMTCSRWKNRWTFSGWSLAGGRCPARWFQAPVPFAPKL